jgi:hypothetical protein
MYPTENKYIQQIADHIKKNLTKGYTLESLKFSLMKQGYSRISIAKAIELANKQLAEEAPKLKEKPEINYTAVTEAVSEENQGIWNKVKSWFK